MCGALCAAKWEIIKQYELLRMPNGSRRVAGALGPQRSAHSISRNDATAPHHWRGSSIAQSLLVTTGDAWQPIDAADQLIKGHLGGPQEVGARAKDVIVPDRDLRLPPRRQRRGRRSRTTWRIGPPPSCRMVWKAY